MNKQKLLTKVLVGASKMIKDYPINIFYSKPDEDFIADIPNLDACSAFGNSPKRL